MTTKTCNKCNTEKTINNFSKHSSTKDKLDNRCKECVKKVKSNNTREKKPSEKDLVQTNLTHSNWQGGKISGSIFERIEKNKDKENKIFITSIGGKQKTFNSTNYNSLEECLIEANKYKKLKSDELKLTSNKYKIIFKNNLPKYIIVQLTKNYITLCDYNQLGFIKNNNLFVSKSGGQGTKQYCSYYNSDVIKRFHGYITGFDMVDHINRYPLDNRKVNLRKTTHMENNRNKNNTNTTSLMTGITFNQKDEAWRGRIKINKKEFNKQFAVKLHGYEEAKQMAITWRNEQAKLTNNYVNKIEEKDLNKHPEFDKLKKEYEEIMTQYAIEFNWKD
jgi:hypothetical protein